MNAYRPSAHNDLLLGRLEKAVHSGNITAIVPEDLEISAHNTLWTETKPTELTILKIMPSVPAFSITHEYTRITSFGSSKGFGFFSERAMAEEVEPGTERLTVAIKLLGLVGPTFLLAHLEKTQKALGQSTAQGFQRTSTRLNLLDRSARATYFADDSTTRSTLRYKGLLQQIREGTDGTVGDASPYGSHIIDMRGQPLDVATLRRKVADTITVFGYLTTLLMDPVTRGDFETSLDSAQRLQLPVGMSPLRIGQNVAGLNTQGGAVHFLTDNTLSWLRSRGLYNATLQEGAPPNAPTVTAVAQADGSSPDDSLWDAETVANDCFYVVSEVANDREGRGTRAPASGLLAVAEGEEVKLTIQQTTTEIDSFRVYRGHAHTGTAMTDAAFIFEVAASATAAPVVAYDDNLWRPRTSVAFGLNIMSDAFNAVTDAAGYYPAKARSTDFLDMADPDGNTVAMAHLGPKYGIMPLASVLAEVDRPLLYGAHAMEVRNPLQQVVFINVGVQS